MIINGAMCISHFCGVECAIAALKFEGPKDFLFFYFFLWLLIYWAYRNFNVWVIWASVTFLFFQKWLESFWFICLFVSQFSTYGNSRWVTSTTRKECPNRQNMSESKRDKWQKKLTENLIDLCHFGQIIVNSDIVCQLFVTLDNFLSIICHLSRLDSNMFLSIRPLFPCSARTWNLGRVFFGRHHFMGARRASRNKIPWETREWGHGRINKDLKGPSTAALNG